MSAYNFAVALAIFGLTVADGFNAHSNKTFVGNNKGEESGSEGYTAPEFQIEKYNQNQKKFEQNEQQSEYLDQHPTYVLTSKTTEIPTTVNASVTSLSTKSSSDILSPMPTKSSLISTIVYEADIPEENTVKLASTTSSSPAKPMATPVAAKTLFENNNSQIDNDLLKKIIDSSVAKSVSVILNGNEPQYTDALGQKVPKPQQSLQVASPINLLNPDRYEFYTFDEYGDLVKRLMTIKEIQSIVANGDDEGPTNIHSGPIEDRDADKNVQNIVESVQNVLNNKVESNKNTSIEILPVFNTPDVSSSWSMILSAIFGNSGSIDIFSREKPQQIIMTPDTEIVESSTTEVFSTTKKHKPSKRKSGQKRKSTTEITPQVIQEELNSQESVYTGMQQYQNLAATMQDLAGVPQLNVQPIYHKLSGTETSTRRVFINNQEVLNNPITITHDDEVILTEKMITKPQSVQHMPKPPHRAKNPSEGHTTAKRPQPIQQKIEETTEASATPISFLASNTSTTSISAEISTVITLTSTAASTSKLQKQKKRKPTRQPVHLSESKQTAYFIAEKRKPSSRPGQSKPMPIQQHKKHPNVTPVSDIAAEVTLKEISNNKFQDVPGHKMHRKPIYDTTAKANAIMTILPYTTMNLTYAPMLTTGSTISYSSFGEDFTKIEHVAGSLTTRATKNKPSSFTSTDMYLPSATSVYPVPSYIISKEQSSNQYKKQTLPSLAFNHQGTKPYEQDEHTLQTFDQIIQTLNQPGKTSEEMTKTQASVSLNVSLKPVLHNNNETRNQLKESADNYINSLQKKPTSSPTLKPSYVHYEIEENTLKTTFINFEITSNLSTSQTRTDKYDIQTHPLNAQATDLYVEKLTKPAETTDIIPRNQSSIKSTDDEVYADQNKKMEYYINQLNRETELPQHSSVDGKYPNHCIFAANLKPQLSIEVVSPSEQIIKSDFQKQAATLASTLTDGTNTDYSTMSSMNNISQVNHTYFNENRYSNQPQLAIPFVIRPIKEDLQKATSIIDPNKKNQSDLINALSMQNLCIAEIAESTTIKDTQTPNPYTEPEKKTYLSFTNLTEEDKKGSKIHTFNDFKLDKNHTNVSDHDEQIASLKEHEQKLEIEADSFIDTTTLINVLHEKVTYSPYEEYQTNLKGQLNTYDEIIVQPGNKISSENIVHSFEFTTLKNYFSEDVPADILGKTSKETNNFNETQAATTEFETTKDLEFAISTSTDTVSTGKYELETDKSDKSNITKKESHCIMEDHTNDVFSKSTEAEEITIYDVQNCNESKEITTTNNLVSQETSAEMNSTISNEDDTYKFIDEDPYVKLGETTTTKSDLSLEIDTQTSLSDIIIKRKSGTEQGASMVAPQKPINIVYEGNIEMETHINKLVETYGVTYKESDEEDNEDQLGYQWPKLPTFDINKSVSTITIKTTTISPRKGTPTRRLSTLKPIQYFNKQSVYVLHQELGTPLYNKESSFTNNEQSTTPKPYSIPSPQQRPMQRPPQLNNLIITSTQASRPPIKLEPSPNNSKGLEASLINLDKDVLSFVKLCNKLAFGYWRSITSEKISSARSLVISPFALTSMLSMVFLGARGNTSAEMNDILKLDDMITFNPHLVFKNITDSIERSMDTQISTTAFVREIYSDRFNGKVLQFFREKTQQLYAGHVEEVNFHVVHDIIRRRTNLLIKRHTMGKVFEYLRTNSVWVNGPLATISANLFQTDCSQGSTQDRDGEIFFQVHPSTRKRRLIRIPAVMFKSGFTAGYEPNLDATVAAFGHIEDTASVIYVMPGHLSSVSPSDNLERLEKQLMETAISRSSWSYLLTSIMDRPGMEVQIPRFSHRSFVNTTLGLQKMGLKGLFKSDFADLGGLTGSSSRDIYLSDMIQINTFSTCGEEKITDHHAEMYPAPPLRKRNKDVDVFKDDDQYSSEAVIDFGSLVQESVLRRSIYDELLDPKYLELPLPLRPRQARVPNVHRLRFDKPFLYFVRHNPTGMILFVGRFNPRILP